MKMHLVRPNDEVLWMCGRFEGYATTDPREVTCKTCEGMYMNNVAWYLDQTNKVDIPLSDNKCHNCGNEILVAIFKGGEWCSDNCRKALGKDVK